MDAAEEFKLTVQASNVLSPSERRSSSAFCSRIGEEGGILRRSEDPNTVVREYLALRGEPEEGWLTIAVFPSTYLQKHPDILRGLEFGPHIFFAALKIREDLVDSRVSGHVALSKVLIEIRCPELCRRGD